MWKNRVFKGGYGVQYYTLSACYIYFNVIHKEKVLLQMIIKPRYLLLAGFILLSSMWLILPKTAEERNLLISEEFVVPIEESNAIANSRVAKYESPYEPYFNITYSDNGIMKRSVRSNRVITIEKWNILGRKRVSERFYRDGNVTHPKERITDYYTLGGCLKSSVQENFNTDTKRYSKYTEDIYFY